MTLQLQKLPGLPSLRSWLMGLAAVLVVVPALINGAFDLYVATVGLPTTHSEQINADLFRKHLNRQPVATFPVPIKQNNTAVELRVSVFEEGDVYVEFGNLTKWFPFHGGEPRPVAKFSFIPAAVAQELANLRGFGRYEQRERIEDQLVVRERRWENGVMQTLKLNPRTGDIVGHRTRQPVTPVNRNRPLSPPPSAAGQAVAGIASIDLDLARAGQARSTPQASPGEITSMCTTAHGACTLVPPARVRSACSCYGPFGAVEGVAR